MTTSTADLRALAETDVRQPIATDQLVAALETPPFVGVPGLFNTRDLGLVPAVSSPQRGLIRPGFLYRTGSLQHLDANPAGQAVLRDQLGVRRIFDLRSREEHARGPDPAIQGVEAAWDASTTGSSADETAKVDLRWFVDREGELGYVAMYMDVLARYVAVFREVVKSVRDRPAEPILFHCTAGRDRTGVLAGLLESLAGYDAHTIQTDFLLSRVGYEPAREQLLRFALEGTGLAHPDDDDDDKKTITTTDMARLFDHVPGFWNLASLKPIYWDTFVAAVDDKYVGFEGYVTRVLGFSVDDLATIRRNLTQAP